MTLTQLTEHNERLDYLNEKGFYLEEVFYWFNHKANVLHKEDNEAEYDFVLRCYNEIIRGQ